MARFHSSAILYILETFSSLHCYTDLSRDSLYYTNNHMQALDAGITPCHVSSNRNLAIETYVFHIDHIHIMLTRHKYIHIYLHST